ncbi:hypothetical protein ACI1UN_01955 [Lactococcus petauri]|uniref:hypothetical protein n=1 Tax=Lactococcus petauri TaxID=1940789 RepID=UPI0038547F59
MKSKVFEEKLQEILEKIASKDIKPVEYALSNEPSKTKGKVNQFVTFMYEVDEPTAENSPKTKNNPHYISNGECS